MSVKFSRYDTADYLKSEEDIVAYLEAAMEDGDPALIAAALGDIARARNVSELARNVGVSRQGLIKALSGEGNPSFATVVKVARELGLQVALERDSNSSLQSTQTGKLSAVPRVPNAMTTLPENLGSLHRQEEQLRDKAIELFSENSKVALHIAVTEKAMNLGDLLRQFPTDDEDLKVAQILGMRMFNAFGASLKLALSGYHQNSALILRDILETVFLLDLFSGDRALIAKWRVADDRTIRRDFSPAAVRKVLDERYGHTTRKREAQYKLFSELAGHPTMKSAWMMRPQKDGDAVIGPFIEKTSLEVVLSEMGRLAVQAGQQLVAFLPRDWQAGVGPRVDFLKATQVWFATFYPNSVKLPENPTRSHR